MILPSRKLITRPPLTLMRGVLSSYGGGGSGFPNVTSGLFDGISDYVDFGDVYDTNGATALSLSFWGKPSTVAQPIGRIFGKINDTGNFGWAVNQVNDALRFQLVGSDGGQLNMAAPSVFSTSSWGFYVITYNGSQVPGGVKIYKNAVSQSLTTILNALDASCSNTGHFNFGTIANGAFGQFYAGLFDEPAIYPGTVLSQSDINALYATTHPTDITGTAGIASWWGFETSLSPADSSTTIYDRIGSINGTPVNFTSSNFSTDAP